MGFLIYMLIGAVVLMLPLLLNAWYSEDPVIDVFSADEDDVGELIAVSFAMLLVWLIWPVSFVIFLTMFVFKKLIKIKKEKK
jgi:heme/copper-type cytochrome/quinol oxidase subunit 2